jgi:hypothetical protein
VNQDRKEAKQERKATLAKKLLCPSAPADVKAIVLGVVRPDGSVAFIKDRIEVTPEFLDTAATGGTLETRFRFSSTCVGKACAQWFHGGCSLPNRLADLVDASVPIDPADPVLPNCSIRNQCRWFDQRGADACGICPLIVTRGGP